MNDDLGDYNRDDRHDDDDDADDDDRHDDGWHGDDDVVIHHLYINSYDTYSLIYITHNVYRFYISIVNTYIGAAEYGRVI